MFESLLVGFVMHVNVHVFSQILAY